MPKDIKFVFSFQDHLYLFFFSSFSGRLKLKSVDCSFYYRSLVLVAVVAILRMKLLKLLGNHSIDLVACTIFNTKLLVNLHGRLTVSLEKGTFWEPGVREAWRSQASKSLAALASDWSLAIYFNATGTWSLVQLNVAYYFCQLHM